MTMTSEEADRILAQQSGSRDVHRFLECYEAMLLRWGCTDDEAQTEEVERVRALLSDSRPDATT